MQAAVSESVESRSLCCPNSLSSAGAQRGQVVLINSLAGNGNLAHISATPGKTQTINHFHQQRLVSCRPSGLWLRESSGQHKRRHKGTIRDFILNSDELAVLFVLIDSRHELQDIDADSLIEWLGEEGVPSPSSSPNATRCQKARSLPRLKRSRRSFLRLGRNSSRIQQFRVPAWEGRDSEIYWNSIKNHKNN